MSDDIWRRRDNTDSNDSSGYGTDFGSDFGTVQFADDPTAEPVLSFGDAETGNLPHWTEPATGELPSTEDDTDVWGTFQEPSEPTRRPDHISIGTDPTDERRRASRDVTADFGWTLHVTSRAVFRAVVLRKFVVLGLVAQAVALVAICQQQSLPVLFFSQSFWVQSCGDQRQ
jgi:hypothetical protein